VSIAAKVYAGRQECINKRRGRQAAAR